MAFNEPAAVARAMLRSDQQTKVVPRVATRPEDGSTDIVSFAHEAKPVAAPEAPPMQERPAVVIAIVVIAAHSTLLSIIAIFSPGWFTLSNGYDYGLLWRIIPDGRSERVCQWHPAGEDPFCEPGGVLAALLMVGLTLNMVCGVVLFGGGLCKVSCKGYHAVSRIGIVLTFPLYLIVVIYTQAVVSASDFNGVTYSVDPTPSWSWCYYLMIVATIQSAVASALVSRWCLVLIEPPAERPYCDCGACMRVTVEEDAYRVENERIEANTWFMNTGGESFSPAWASRRAKGEKKAPKKEKKQPPPRAFAEDDLMVEEFDIDVSRTGMRINQNERKARRKSGEFKGQQSVHARATRSITEAPRRGHQPRYDTSDFDAALTDAGRPSPYY